jgi:hypothetical protein
VLVSAVNVAPVPLALPFIFNVLELPRSAPLVLVHVPLNVCVKLVPRSSVPPTPLMVSPAPFTLPVNVAVPAVFVIDTVPVVVKPTMLCSAVPVIIIAALPQLMGSPLLTKLPLLKVKLAVPCLERIPFIVVVPAGNVFALVPESVRL